MKRLILSIATCIFSASGNAQLVTGGPEIGVNFSTLSTMANGVQSINGTRAGLKIGGVINIGLTRHLSLQPGLFYTVKGAQETYVNTSSNLDNSIITTDEHKYDYRINYLELPINLNVKYGPLIFGGGPYIARALNGTNSIDHITTVDNNGVTTVTSRHTSTSLQIGNNANADDVKSNDVGINMYMGLQNQMGFFVRANLGIGIMNIMPGGDANNYMRNNSFTISAGYLFGY